MMKRFISKVSILIALVVVLASCEVSRWEEVPVEYRKVYCIDYRETLGADTEAGMPGVYKYHIYFDCEPYALLTFSDDSVVTSVTEIYDIQNQSGYPAGETTYLYSLSFKEKVRTRQADGEITESVRTYQIEGYENATTTSETTTVIITDDDTTVYGGDNVARIYTTTRPYENGFWGYEDYTIDLME